MAILLHVFMQLILVSVFIGTMYCMNDTTCSNKDDSSSYDIIIVGAGITGLLQTHLLQRYYHNKQILLLEKLNRVGGRQLSSKISLNNKSIMIEHGAFRTYYSHQLTMQVLYYLNLCDELIPFGSDVDSFNTLFETRDSRILKKDIDTKYWCNAYHLTQTEQQLIEQNNADPFKTLFTVGLQKLFSENNKSSLPITKKGWYYFRNNWTFLNISLNRWGLYPWIKALNFSLEFANMLYDIFVLPKYIQLGTFLTNIFNGNDNNTVTLQNGYDGISKKLVELINVENILLGHNVISIDKYNLNDNHLQHRYLIQAQTVNNTIKLFKAKKIILSIPPNELQHLLYHTPILNAEKIWNLLNSLISGVAVKINLIYNSTVWLNKSLLLSLSESITASKEFRKIIIDRVWNNGSLISIMVYPASLSAEYWLMLQETGKNNLYPVNENIIINNINDIIIASHMVVDELSHQLSQFLQFDISMPLAAFISSSTAYLWKQGYNVDDVLQQIYKPDKKENIYVAVSDFSWDQNIWTQVHVEGAFWAAINNLVTNFNVTNSFTDSPKCQLLQ